LETIKTQFQTEKNDIRAQVKGNLGADAKPVDIMRAMRDNPQAKALEARMQEATAKLSERIGAGTTTNTVKDSGARARDMALREMHDANATRDIINKPTESRINSTKKNNVEAESEEIESAIEEPTFEGQSDKVGLKDLNEQLVQLNTSIRQLIQHSADSVETAGKQVKATKGLSGNRFA
jgi:hypothetical protein